MASRPSPPDPEVPANSTRLSTRTARTEPTIRHARDPSPVAMSNKAVRTMAKTMDEEDRQVKRASRQGRATGTVAAPIIAPARTTKVHNTTGGKRFPTAKFRDSRPRPVTPGSSAYVNPTTATGEEEGEEEKEETSEADEEQANISTSSSELAGVESGREERDGDDGACLVEASLVSNPYIPQAEVVLRPDDESENRNKAGCMERITPNTARSVWFCFGIVALLVFAVVAIVVAAIVASGGNSNGTTKNNSFSEVNGPSEQGPAAVLDPTNTAPTNTDLAPSKEPTSTPSIVSTTTPIASSTNIPTILPEMVEACVASDPVMMDIEDARGNAFHLSLQLGTDQASGMEALSGTVVHEGLGWLAFAISEGGMIGSLALIGLPDEDVGASNPGKYTLGQFAVEGIVLTDQQTLMDSSIEQNETHTTLTFTKFIEEEGELSVNPNGDNIFLVAAGSSNELGYHAARNLFSTTLGCPCGVGGHILDMANESVLVGVAKQVGKYNVCDGESTLEAVQYWTWSHHILSISKAEAIVP